VIPIGTRLIAFDCDCVLQRFHADGRVETIWRDPETGKLPDVEQLNEEVPKAEWRISQFTGLPEEPWGKYFAVYLLNPDTGEAWTYISKSASASIAYTALRTKIRNKRIMCGAVMPVVELRTAKWHSKKRNLYIDRPDFHVTGEWLSRGQPAIAAEPAVKQIEYAKPVLDLADRPTIDAEPDRFDGIPAYDPQSADDEYVPF
jgi:hypothetical protein